MFVPPSMLYEHGSIYLGLRAKISHQICSILLYRLWEYLLYGEGFFNGLKWQKIGSKSVHRRGQCIAGPAQDCRSFYMGLAGLLKAGWLNLVTSSRMDRMGLLAMGRTAWTTCSRFARAAIAGKRHGKPDGLGGEMPPGGRGGEILPGVA